MIPIRPRELQRLARHIKMLVLDVDGVFTEGELILIGDNLEAKRFSFHDGLGVLLLRSVGIQVALMSDRTSEALRRRAAEMGVDEICPVHNGDKESSLDALLEKAGLEEMELGYVGDDLRDVPPMKRVALPIAVANARPEVKGHSVYVTCAAGGHGAVREVAEWLLELRGQKESALAPFMQTRREKLANSTATSRRTAGKGLAMGPGTEYE